MLGEFLNKNHQVERLISEGKTKMEACAASKMELSEYEKEIKLNAEAKEGYEQAMRNQVEWLEAQARKQAVEGYVEETQDANGTIIKRVKKFNGDLLMKLLAARDSRYKNNAGNTQVNIDLGGMMEKARARVKKINHVESPNE
ncbi:MAG: hypothetical protein ACRDFB_03235 [Rhabdochlamydiaceae bacterium]